MKALAFSLISLALLPLAWAAETSMPAPRPRLEIVKGAPQRRTPQAEDGNQGGASSAETVQMEKVVVESPTLPTGPQPYTPPNPRAFSFPNGGPLRRIKLSSTTIEFGLWAWRDILAEEAQFQPPQARADLEMVRMRW